MLIPCIALPCTFHKRWRVKCTAAMPCYAAPLPSTQVSVHAFGSAKHTIHDHQITHPSYMQEAVIDTLVAKVQGVPGDDRCVLLLGYEEPMQTMMREANPGLARRFQLSQAWYFEDYDKDDLLAILAAKAKSECVHVFVSSKSWVVYNDMKARFLLAGHICYHVHLHPRRVASSWSPTTICRVLPQ